mmetsp:Transcript_10446/g.29810  ORF Transcript_10446/g.29810 Transcript_10446/m.29810 type:complete len:215 (+) Transcript_10446:378-1022(+)
MALRQLPPPTLPPGAVGRAQRKQLQHPRMSRSRRRLFPRRTPPPPRRPRHFGTIRHGGGPRRGTVTCSSASCLERTRPIPSFWSRRGTTKEAPSRSCREPSAYRRTRRCRRARRRSSRSARTGGHSFGCTAFRAPLTTTCCGLSSPPPRQSGAKWLCTSLPPTASAPRSLGTPPSRSAPPMPFASCAPPSRRMPEAAFRRGRPSGSCRTGRAAS